MTLKQLNLGSVYFKLIFDYYYNATLENNKIMRHIIGAQGRNFLTGFQQFWSISNYVYRTIFSVYLGLSWAFSGFLWLFRAIFSIPCYYPWVYSAVLGISGYLWLSMAISGYLRLSQACSDYIGIYWSISVYLGLSLSISVYLCLSISGFSIKYQVLGDKKKHPHFSFFPDEL